MTTERLVTEYTADTRNFRRGARVYDQTLARQERLTNDRLSRIDRRWERSTRSILNTRTALVGLTGYVGGAALSQLRNYAEQWRDVERRLKSIGEFSKESRESLVDLAIRTRSAVGGTASIVQRFQKSTGDGLEITMRRVETLQKLLASNGATGSERNALGIQLGQALQSGVLSGDEFRTIRENSPIEFLDALAAAAGVTRAELKGIAEDQKLTTAVVLQALDGLASTADQKFGALAVSGEEAFNILTNGLVVYAGQIDESLGATASLNGAMVSLGEYMSGAGEGAQTMAQAIKVVGAVALATAGSRGLGAMSRAFRNSAEARRLNVSAAQAESRASRQAVIDAQTELAAKRAIRRERELDHQRQVFNDRGAVQSAKRRRAAIIAEEQALNRLKVAQARATASSVALTAAQRQLSVATRITTGAVRAFNGVMAFFGGPVGLAITAATLFVAVLANAKTNAERLQNSLDSLSGTFGKIENVNSSLASDYEALTTAQDRLADATRKGGQAAIDAATQEVAAVNSRILANEKLRRELALTAEAELNAARELLDAQRLQLERDARTSLLEGFWERVRGGPDAGFFERNFSSPDTAEWEEFNRIQRATTEELQAHIDAERERARQLIETGATMEDLTEFQRDLISGTTEAEVQVEELSARLELLNTAAVVAADGIDVASASARQLAADAAAAQAGIAGLIAAIPELQRASQVQARLSKAQADRDAALEGIDGQGLSGLGRLEAEREVISLYERAVSEIDGTAKAIRDADRALDDYTDRAHLDSLSAREQAIIRERRAYDELRASLVETGATEEELRRAELAHNQNLQTIESRFKERGRGGGGGRSRGGSAREAERDLAAARELLVENGQKALYIEQELNAERQRLLELLPALIDMGLSRADAEAVINSELERTEERLKRVKSASEEAAESFAKGILSDIRHADSLGDAIGRIGDRLLDLALDPVFDFLAQQFASLATGGGGGGLLGQIFGFLFNANGNAFNSAGVVPFARGGVVDRPTLFNFAGNRKGVMGEAGPEAILPLSRGKNGKLGVVAELPTTPSMPAGGMQTNSTFSWTGDMVIQSNSDQPQEVGQEVTDQMRAMFVQMFSKQLGDAMRGGGVLNSTYQKKAGA